MGNMVSNVLIAVFLKAECRIGREDEVRSKCVFVTVLSSAMENGCSVHRITLLRYSEENIVCSIRATWSRGDHN